MSKREKGAKCIGLESGDYIMSELCAAPFRVGDSKGAGLEGHRARVSSTKVREHVTKRTEEPRQAWLVLWSVEAAGQSASDRCLPKGANQETK